jgi:aspartyl protease family protein
MGLTQLTVRIANPTDPSQYRDVEFIVDSGAVFTVAPKKVLKEIGIKPRSKRTFILANGEKFERRVGTAEFEYKGARGGASVVFGEEGDFPLLGVTTLEALGLIFDALHQELKPALMLMAFRSIGADALTSSAQT